MFERIKTAINDSRSKRISKIVSGFNTSVPGKYKKNNDILNKCIEQGRFDLLSEFDESILTEEVIEKYSEEIASTIENSVPKRYKNNKKILRACMEQEKFELLEQFDEEKLTNQSAREIVSTFTNLVPYEYRNREIILKECINQGKFDLLEQFNGSILTEDIVDKYKKEIVQNLDDCLFSPSYKNNMELCKECIKQERFDLLGYFNIMPEEYAKKIVSTFDTYVPMDYINNISVFKECIRQERFDLLGQFNVNGYDESLLNECIKRKKFGLLIYFDKKVLPEEKIEEIINKYKTEIVSTFDSSVPYVPYIYHKSEVILKECIEQGKFNLLSNFDESILTEEVIEKYKREIVSTFDDHVPRNYLESETILKECIEQGKFNLLQFFSSDLELSDETIDKLISYFHGGKLKIATTLCINNKSLISGLMKKNDKELIQYLKFDKDILNSQELLRFYAESLSLSDEELKIKLETLLNQNDEILDTLYPRLLNKKLEKISLKNIEKLGIYSDIQVDLIELDTINFTLVSKIIESIDSSKYDLNPIMYNILKNIKSHSNLIKSLDIPNLTEDDLKHLIIIINYGNVFNINNQEDLKQFDKREKEYYQRIQDRINDKSIDIEELRQALLLKEYGLSLEESTFIYERYCKDLKSLKENLMDNTKSCIDSSLYKLLFSISIIHKTSNLEKLEYLWSTSEKNSLKNYQNVSLETLIRSKYAKMYSDSLYKIKEDDKIDESNPLMKENPNVYNILFNKEYEGEKVKFYIMDGDFNMQVHALGAYFNWERPSNFKDDWNRPKIAYHGICTSYIGNDEIATAPQAHPIYGFDNYEESALLCAGNYDLWSTSSINKYATGVDKPYSFYPPKVMIDKTRDIHNEMVLERRNNSLSKSFKREPNYVVYIVDDMNNENNFTNDNRLFKETLQASKDWGIPIVIVDRLKYAKSEMQRCEDLKQKFYETNDFKYLKQLFTKFCNNIVGCIFYDIPEVESKNKFSKEKLSQLFHEIFNYLKSSNDVKSINSLLDIVNNEEFLREYSKELYTYLETIEEESKKTDEESKHL